MVRADSDVPPGSDPNPPADALVSGMKQVLNELQNVKKQLAAIEKLLKMRPVKKTAKKK